LQVTRIPLLDREFGYRIAVTRLRGTATAVAWAQEPPIKENLRGCSFGFLTLKDMWNEVLNEATTAPSPSEIGRLAQLLLAGGLATPTVFAGPGGPQFSSDAHVAEEPERESPWPTGG
jgi:hypothetical protein